MGFSLVRFSVKILSRMLVQGDLFSRVTSGSAGNVSLFSCDISHRMNLILTLLHLTRCIWLQTSVMLPVCLRQMF